MKIFDSHINKTSFNFPLEVSSSSTFSIPININNDVEIEIICKKQSGDSFLTISFYYNDLLIKSKKETIDFTVFASKKITYEENNNINKIIIKKNKGSIGRIIINRIIIKEKKREIFDLYSKICFIVPYQLHGGAEVYLENLLINAPKDLSIDLLVNGRPKISEFNFPKNIKVKNYLNNIFDFLKTNNYEQIIFYNSKKLYNNLLLYKKINPTIKIYEIYHSDFLWSDSMSSIENRHGINTVFKTSNMIGKNIISENQIICPPPLLFNKFNFSRKLSKIKMLGFIGRLSPEKNPFLAVDIAEKLSIPLLIAGDGPLKKDLISYCKYKENITLLGWQNAIDFYKKIDCLLLTSKIEGTPNVILEAMASGLPIISTNVGGIPDMLNNTESLLFDEDSFNIEDLKRFIVETNNYNYKNVLKSKTYDIDIISNIFYNVIIKDFKKPIEIDIKNSFKIIEGILL